MPTLEPLCSGKYAEGDRRRSQPQATCSSSVALPTIINRRTLTINTMKGQTGRLVCVGGRSLNVVNAWATSLAPAPRNAKTLPRRAYASSTAQGARCFRPVLRPLLAGAASPPCAAASLRRRRRGASSFRRLVPCSAPSAVEGAWPQQQPITTCSLPVHCCAQTPPARRPAAPSPGV
jgi:hypothetical protein